MQLHFSTYPCYLEFKPVDILGDGLDSSATTPRTCPGMILMGRKHCERGFMQPKYVPNRVDQVLQSAKPLAMLLRFINAEINPNEELLSFKQIGLRVNIVNQHIWKLCAGSKNVFCETAQSVISWEFSDLSQQALYTRFKSLCCQENKVLPAPWCLVHAEPNGVMLAADWPEQRCRSAQYFSCSSGGRRQDTTETSFRNAFVRFATKQILA